MPYVTPLQDITRHDLALAGGKGASLGELVRAGFPVPEGFVITTAAYDAYTRGSSVVDLSSFDRPVTDDIAAEITAAYAGLGPDAVVAVRSSATAEDLPEASFAGQQESFLGIHGVEALLDAVRRCWASLRSERAVAYRAKAGVDEATVSLAVVVQRLVDADAAGVLFTANPANGRRHESVINAAFGFGEAVVGGQVTPDEIVVGDERVLGRTIADKALRTVRVDQGTATQPVAGPERTASVLSEGQAVELATLGRRIEAHFGAPQDIEWVLADGVFHVVQSRPITALPEPTGPVPTDWSVPRSDGMYMRASIVEQLPDPLSPLFADLIRPAVVRSLGGVMARYFGSGFVREGELDFPTVNGFAYYFYSTAAMRRMLAGAPFGVTRVFGRQGDFNGITLWRNVGHPAYQRVVDLWSGRDPAVLTDTELLEGAGALIAAGAEYYTYVQAVIPQAATSEIAFTRLYNTFVLGEPGTDKPPALTFLLGLDSAPLRAERSLYALAQWCRSVPALADAVGSGRPVPAEHAEEFEARLAGHLAEFGHLVYNLDVLQPVAADDPAPVLAALAHFVSGRAANPEARSAHLVSERHRAEEWLDRNVDPVRRRLFASLLERAHRLGPLREDALADIGLGWPTARRLLRELGRRLVQRGVIDEPDDVFWLTLDEAHWGVGRPPVAERRERWRGQRLANPPGWLPASGFFHRLFKRFMPSNESEQAGSSLKGLGASVGRATGPARLLRGPEDFGRMQPGDILVAPITTPAYTPFFAMAAGVVTDIGGPLSHSSIVAREYGIPAVLGTGSATHRIHDGDIITVDGERGVVHLPVLQV